MMTVNPVTRGDVRSRLASANLLWVLRLYVAVLGLFAVFALPPESGRLPGLLETDLMQVFLLFALGWIAYLTSSLAVGEISVVGEKSVLDLAVTSFPPRTIALGKLWTSASVAALLALATLPLVALITPLNLRAVPALMRALASIVVLAVPLAAVGTWLGTVVSGVMPRTLVHWSLFLGVFAGTRWLPYPEILLNPLRLVAAAYRGTPPAWPLALLPFLAIAAGGTFLTERAVVRLRREPA